MASWTEPLDPDTASKRRGKGWSLFLIFLGGALGTHLRYTVEAAVPSTRDAWPLATFLINITGALILGALLEILQLSGPDAGWRRRVRLGAGTGLLGGFTTYSSFTTEAAMLADVHHYLIAFGYAVASVLLGVVAALAGMTGATALYRRARAAS